MSTWPLSTEDVAVAVKSAHYEGSDHDRWVRGLMRGDIQRAFDLYRRHELLKALGVMAGFIREIGGGDSDG